MPGTTSSADELAVAAGPPSSSRKRASLHSHARTCTTVPPHPIPALAGAFLESIHTADTTAAHHRLTKLIAQLSFGLFLLHTSTAKSESEVVTTLQSHINDLDLFLSRTLTALDLAASDISTRLQNLRLPLSLPDVFDRMLQARTFRREILQRNSNVLYVVTRTQTALQQALSDTARVLSAVELLSTYLVRIKENWPSERLKRVHAAMQHNVAMWLRCCLGIQMKGARVERECKLLESVVQEIEKRTGEASRKYTVGVVRSPPSNTSTNRTTVKITPPDKPLPAPPEMELPDLAIPTRRKSAPLRRKLSKRGTASPPAVAAADVGALRRSRSAMMMTTTEGARKGSSSHHHHNHHHLRSQSIATTTAERELEKKAKDPRRSKSVMGAIRERAAEDEKGATIKRRKTMRERMGFPDVPPPPTRRRPPPPRTNKEELAIQREGKGKEVERAPAVRRRKSVKERLRCMFL